MSAKTLVINGRTYRRPERGDPPTVVVCLDGADPRHLSDALEAGCCPELSRWRSEGCWLDAEGVLPSFTNPNNVSIITGTPPSRHGISANHFFDPAQGVEVPMTDPVFLRADSILDRLRQIGVRALAITAKDKLRRLLAGADPEAAFSAERPGELGEMLAGRSAPEIYSAGASLFVLEAGLGALERGRADVLYLSTTDYMQHRYPTGHPELRRFYAALDARLRRLSETGATVVVTADHGMNPKSDGEGRPQVVFLSEALEAMGFEARVVLPITDPYVRHHGALGSCAFVDLDDPETARRALLEIEGVDAVWLRTEASELPPDRVGDLIVFARADFVLGKRRSDHDLSALAGPLHSHGGRHEVSVPLIGNRSLSFEPGRRHRNFDAFALALGEA